MDYKKLSEEYFNEAEVLKSYIKKLKNFANNLTNEMQDDNDLFYRISIMYKMYLELKHVGEYLNRRCTIYEK